VLIYFKTKTVPITMIKLAKIPLQSLCCLVILGINWEQVKINENLVKIIWDQEIPYPVWDC